nr:uncharacterized protein K02A2.6-like [Neodiprion pinetum]
MSNKKNISWIYDLSKSQVIEELKKRQTFEEESLTLDKLRTILKKLVKSEQKDSSESSEGSTENLDKKELEVKTITLKKKMEFNAKVNFELGQDDWEQFVERMEFYFEANEIKEEKKKKAIFLSKVNSKIYAEIRKICAPKKLNDVTLTEIIDKVTNHLKPKVNVTVLRLQFRRRNQNMGETVAQYEAALQELATKCEFKDSSDAIKDQFLSGILSDDIRETLFKLENLTLQLALKTATACEEAKVASSKVKANGEQSENKQDLLQLKSEIFRGSANKRFNHKRGSTFHQNKGKFQGKNSSRYQQRNKNNTRNNSNSNCHRCGKPNHEESRCWHKDKTCNKCNKKGHLESVCWSGGKNQATLKNLQEKKEDKQSSTDDESWFDDFFRISVSDPIMKINSLEKKEKIDPQYLNVKVGNKVLKMEVDGGAGISVISQSDYEKYFAKNELKNCNLKINYYCGKESRPVGILRDLKIEYEQIATTGNLYVMEGSGVPLLGRDWLSKLGLWPLEIKQKIVKPCLSNTINCIKKENKLEALREKIFEKHANLFSPGIGTFTKGKIKIHLKDNAVPIYHKPRSVPFALKEKIENELDRLTKEKIISPVDVSEWGTPIVPVLKPDGTVRICGDYKVTVNPLMVIDRHPLPRVEHLIAEAQGGEIFSKIDLKEAFAQVEVENSSKDCLTISTHKGLYRPNKLFYGVASAPGYFQKKMEQIFAKVPNVYIFIDDIYIKAKNIGEMLKTLETVFNILEECGLKIRKRKCDLLRDRIRYLGVEIDKNGVRTINERIEAIDKIPEPKNLKQLQSFLGTINYYEKFIKNRAEKFAPLYNCLKKNSFNWTQECKIAFQNAKTELKAGNLLINYDPKKPLILTCDASDNGISAVLSHLTKDGERPIAYAAKAPNSHERNYAIIDKEAKAIIFGVTKFYDYIYGREFTLKTDNEPLVRIFGPKKGIPIMAAQRLQRYAEFLSAFRYNIKYVKSSANCADGLSRLVNLNEKEINVKENTYLNYIENETNECLDWKIVSRETRKDLVLAKVMNYVKYGWPKGKLPDEITPFLNRKDELTIEQDCILWGYRVIIPGKMINTILNELHKTHLGIVKMKAVARSFFWWPGIDACIERTAKACDECARERDNPPASYLNPWKWPCGVWVRIHSDLIGPIDGLTFLLILDARSKWPEIFLMPNTTSESLIKMFRQVFARFGFPECLITDNGPQYTALEFKLFVKKSGIKHVKSAVKHPETNGAAENLVRTFRKAYKKLKRQGLSTQKAIDTFLFDYRTTKHCTTGETPAKLMLGKELRTRFTLLLSNTEQKVNEKHDCQIQHKRGKRIIEFKEGDLVWAMNFSKNAAPWLEAKIKSRIGPVNYLIEWESGKVDKRHVDQIVTRETVELDDVAQTNEKANVEKTVLLRRSARLLEREQKLSGEKV